MILRGRLFDGQSVFESAEISVNQETGTIEYVDPVSQSGASRDGREIQSEVTFLPGLVDAHVHFFGTGTSVLSDWVLQDVVQVTVNSVNDARSLIEAGFTTVRALGDRVSLGMAESERRGQLLGPRIVSAGRSLAATGGNDDPKFLDQAYASRVSYSYYCDGPWECRRAVRLNHREGARVIKAYSSSSFVGGGEIHEELTPEELFAVADEAHRLGLRAASHAYGEQAIRDSVEAGFDTIEHGLGITEPTAEEMRKKGVFYVPTLSVYATGLEGTDSFRQQAISAHLMRDVQLAMSCGVKIAGGTDYLGSRRQPHGRNSDEFLHLSKIMGAERALSAVTSVGAECLGAQNLGYVRKGYLADVIAVRGDPLVTPEHLKPENVVFVMKSGKVLKDSLPL